MADQPPVAPAAAPKDVDNAPLVRALTIKRYRGIKEVTWLPGKGLNVILGGGDVGKTTILDAIALLLSPTNAVSVSDTDYFMRDIDAEFSIEPFSRSRPRAASMTS
jgi:putative ATP-dependent endonuclease of the OLD family